MKIQEILQKQGELYKNLTSNETIQKCNEKIEKPKPPKLVPYKEFLISEQEYKAITELVELVGLKPGIYGEHTNSVFEIGIEDNQIVSLNLVYGLMTLGWKLDSIPKQINNLPNLQNLNLWGNKITKIENLDSLTNLQQLQLQGNKIQKIENLPPNIEILYLSSNKIQKIENLDNLQNLKELRIGYNQITEIEGLDNMQNLQYLDLSGSQISEIKNLNNLPNLRTLYIKSNKIKEVRNLDNLTNLQYLELSKNQISRIYGLNNLTNLESIDLRFNDYLENSPTLVELVELRNKGVRIDL